MATGGLYGSSGTGALIAQPGSESSGLYGNSTSFGGTYFEWFVFQTSETQPATPTGGTWNFTTNANTPPTGWSSAPPSNPLNTVWVSIAIVNSKNTAALVWSAPGKFAFSSGLPILSDNGAPEPADGQSDQLYIQLNTVPQTIWFKESGTWTRLTGSTLYADLTSNQTIAGTKTFSSQIQGSISGNASNVTGTVAITNGGTGSTTAGSARAALGAAASGANSDITSLSGLTTALSLVQGGTGATTASDARTNLGLGSAAVLTAGAANGVATLDAGGTVPLSQIPASIQGGVSYQGTWNATTNTPTLTSSVGTKGYYYVVSVAGSTNLNGLTSWNIGDWAIFNGTAWEKIDNTDAVTSVNGYTGTVVLTQPDISGTASLTTTQTLTNKTLTSPIINFINDTSGNEVLNFSPTASATDFLTVKNGIGVAVPLHVYADGPSANIGLHIQPKGTGLVTISDGTDFNKGIRFRSSGSAASAVTLLDAVATAGRVVTLPDATTTLVGRDTTDTLTNKTINLANNTLTGTASININGTVGATTPNTGAFTTLTTSGAVTHNAGTANGVAYLNGSKVLTTGSALTFDGTNLFLGTGYMSFGNNGYIRADSANNKLTFQAGTSGYLWKDSSNSGDLMALTSTGLGIGTSSPAYKLDIAGTSYARMTTTTFVDGGFINARTALSNGTYNTFDFVEGSTITAYLRNFGSAFGGSVDNHLRLWNTQAAPITFGTNNTEQMRLTSTGLGIGTSSPTAKLDVNNGANSEMRVSTSGSGFLQVGQFTNGAFIGTSSTDATAGILRFGTGGTTRATLDSSGNLGIGTSSPTRKLDVAGNGFFSAGLTVADTSAVNWGAWTSIQENGFFDAGGNFLHNAIKTSGVNDTWTYRNNGSATRYKQLNSVHSWYTAPSGTAGNAISFTQAMTLDASGNLGVGTTTPSNRLNVVSTSTDIVRFDSTSASNYGEILIRSNGGAGNNTRGRVVGGFDAGGSGFGGFLAFNTTTTQNVDTERARIDSSGRFMVGTTSPVSSGITVTGGYWSRSADLGTVGGVAPSNGGIVDVSSFNGSGGVITFTTANTGGSNTERARIDSSGNLLVGKTSTNEAVNGIVLNPQGLGIFSRTNGDPLSLRRMDSDGAIVAFRRDATLVGTISVTTSATVYNTTSDYRLKTVIGPVANAGQRIDALQPVEYTWNASGERTRGFLAHQFQEVYAGSVSGSKDAVDAEGKPVYQSMQASTSEVIADLVAEIQSLRQRLAAAGI